ncbi:MAG TPA: hypothetical protein VG652_02360 [Gaiellaceae bacterium]|nr:hypothetical protein [Gaiellaceae bacterium]
MSGRIALGVLVALVLATATESANAAAPAQGSPAYDCSKLLPAHEFGALTGGSFTLAGVTRTASTFESTCHYGENLVVIDAGKTGLATYDRWVDEATASTEKYPCPPTVMDTRDCSLTALPGYGNTATAYRRTIVAHTRDGAFLQVESKNRSLTYEQLEPVVKYLLPKIK